VRRVISYVEGLPDRDFYYLIGVRIGQGDAAVQYSLWADTVEGERTIWNEMLSILGTVKNPVLIHYGSYETVFLRRMCERYGEPLKGSAVAEAIRTPVNLLAVTFARVYFPTFSNGLKDIGGYLGFRWSDSVAAGLQSIRWRHEWETEPTPATKQALLTYNAQDCEAVGVVASKLVELHHASLQTAGSPTDGVVDTAMMKREKHRVSVDRFYRMLSTMALKSEAAVKLRDRFQKNREKLFTFLRFDGVPWNNNNAEHAVKAFATLRKVIGGCSTEKGIREYLILLSICETCKYKGLDFLDFLRSGEKNIDTFASSLRRRRLASASTQTAALHRGTRHQDSPNSIPPRTAKRSPAASCEGDEELMA
jgi:hypothetical protein